MTLEPMRALLAGLILFSTVATATAQIRRDPPAPPDLTMPPVDAVTSPTGLLSNVVTAGTFPDRPTATDIVTVHYTGWSSDGQVIDSSRRQGDPVTFPLDRSLSGWRECVQLMTVGETRRCWLPQELAYRGRPGRPTGTVVFDIELIDAWSLPDVPPADVTGPPDDAIRTATGLAYKVLRAGTGVQRPAPWNRVTVQYNGWTTDGLSFDSSVERGAPTAFDLTDVIPGWTEGVQLMVEGERTRFWVPEELAYDGQEGAPAGMLVFDIGLISIE